jgi:uncharacterized protein YprB with RNaseH-like and TPR domain
MAISLGDRLRQVVGGGRPTTQATPDENSEPVAVRRPSIDGLRVADVLAGRWMESHEGAVVVVDRYYAADRLHGRTPIGELVDTLESGTAELDALARAWPRRRDRASLNPNVAKDGADSQYERYGPRLCFLDLETTGLAGGAGTQAFLVGCAAVEDGGLRVRQFLLPGFEHERALLTMVAAWTEGHDTLVTFNGRSFDVPLIETRYLLHRLSCTLTDVPHLDMLHPARRLWKQRPSVVGPPLDDESCRLSVLERHLAGYYRVGDVPGFEIPSRYFRFVRSGDANPLEAVLEHNRIDLISLALVTARTLTLVRRGPAAATHPRECLGLGRLYERSGAHAEAEACFERAASWAGQIGREADVHADALRRLALARRRAGRLYEAAVAWQSLLTVPGCPSVLRREAREALAIHHEHRSRDLQTARSIVLDVLADSAVPKWRERAEYRLQRLERKLARPTHPRLPIDDAERIAGW